MKKITVLMLLVLIVISVFPGVAHAYNGIYVFDEGNYMHENEIFLFEQQLFEISKYYGFNMFFVIKNPNTDETLQELALSSVDEYLHESSTQNGAIVAVDLETYTGHVETLGSGADYMSEDVISQITSAIESSSTAEYYVSTLYMAATAFTQAQKAYGYPNISENAGILTDDEEALVNDRIDSIKSAYDFDVTLVTTSTLFYSELSFYADNYVLMDDNSDGMVFEINVDFENNGAENGYYMSTRNNAMSIFPADTRESMASSFTPALADAQYYHAVEIFLNDVESVLSGGGLSTSSASSGSWLEQYGTLLIIAAVGGVVIAYFVTLSMKKKMNTAVEQWAAHDYMRKDSLQFMEKSDVFQYSTVTKTRRAKSTGSSSSSGSNFSGSSRGGTGGRF